MFRELIDALKSKTNFDGKVFFSYSYLIEVALGVDIKTLVLTMSFSWVLLVPRISHAIHPLSQPCNFAEIQGQIIAATITLELEARYSGRVEFALLRTIASPVRSEALRIEALRRLKNIQNEPSADENLSEALDRVEKQRFEALSQFLEATGVAHSLMTQRGYLRILILPGHGSDWNEFARRVYQNHHTITAVDNVPVSNLQLRQNVADIAFAQMSSGMPGAREQFIEDRLAHPLPPVELEPRIFGILHPLARGRQAYINPSRNGPRRIEVPASVPYPHSPLTEEDPLQRFGNTTRNMGFTVSTLVRHYHPRILADGREISPAELLPSWMRNDPIFGVYGYSQSPLSVHGSCHAMTVLITRPHLRDIFADELTDDYIENTYRELGSEEQPQYGDVAVIYSVSTPDESLGVHASPLRRLHSVVMVTDQVVWSKSGAGRHHPLFLRDWSEVLQEWMGRGPPSRLVRIVVRYFRNEPP